VDQGGGYGHHGAGPGIGHGLAELKDIVPTVAVTTLRIVDPAGWDFDVPAPRRKIGWIGLVVVADIPVARRGRGDVVMGPPVPVGDAEFVLEVTVVVRLEAVIEGIDVIGRVVGGGHQVDGVSPGLGETWASAVDHTAAKSVLG